MKGLFIAFSVVTAMVIQSLAPKAQAAVVNKTIVTKVTEVLLARGGSGSTKDTVYFTTEAGLAECFANNFGAKYAMADLLPEKEFYALLMSALVSGKPVQLNIMDNDGPARLCRVDMIKILAK